MQPSLTLSGHDEGVRTARPQPEAAFAGPPLWEQVAAGFVVCMLTGALIGPVFAPDQGETPILRLVWLPVYAVTISLILFRSAQVVRAWPAWLALGALVALAFASKYWSIDPATTVRRVVALTMTGSFAIYLGSVFRGPALPRLLMNVALTLGVGSLVMVFAFPAIGVHHGVNDGLWRGLWYEKNQMGLVMVAGATAATACLATGWKGRLVPAAALVITTGLMLATQSKTSLLCWVIGVGVCGGLWTLRKGGPALTVVGVWGGVVAASGVLFVLLTDAATVLKALGKDPTLTGRTDIWDSLMTRVAEQPWTGYGYMAFWGKHSVPANMVRMETGWLVPSAHNGWIDLLVQLGWPGGILVGLMFLAAVVLLLARMGRMGVREGYWSLAYLMVYFLLSLSESVLVSHQDLPWALFLAILARAMTPDPPPDRVILAPATRSPYQTRPRIAADCPNGRPVLHARRF